MELKNLFLNKDYFEVLEIKGTVHIKIKILSSFIDHYVVPNLHDFSFSVEHKRRYIVE